MQRWHVIQYELLLQLARFIVEVVEGLDISALEKGYAGRGSAAYHPTVLLSPLVHGYATGVFSSWKIKRATYDSVAFRFIAAGTHPDHDTLANFRRRFLAEWAGLFMQVLELAREMKLLKLGPIKPPTLTRQGLSLRPSPDKGRTGGVGSAEIRALRMICSANPPRSPLVREGVMSCFPVRTGHGLH